MKTAYLTYLLAAIGFSLSAPFAQAVGTSAIGTIGDLNDTGQTLCYDGTNMVTCTAANTGDDAPYPRQDGRYGRDAQALAGQLNKIGTGDAGFDFTKIANNGTELPASATQGTNPTDWACTRDNVTGLMWDARSASNDSRYTWYNAANLATSTNSTGLCGFKDWRLPDIHELYGITHAGKVNPAIDPSFFPNTKSAWYWTNTTYAPGPTDAWIVNFDFGYDDFSTKANNDAVRLVRFGQWLDPFHDNLDGTITHIPSGAIWAKCSVGQTYSNGTCTGAASYMTWQQALKAAKDSRFLGFSDWRLPNKQELMSLVDFSTFYPAINSTYFPSTLSTYYWTSTTVTDYPTYAWVVLFGIGLDDYNNKTDNYAVRLVRFGQCFDPLTGACGGTISTNILTVNKTGTGSGIITSSPAGIDCGNTCSASFNNNTDVTLNASANSNSLFTGWSGDCSGTSSSCTVKMSAAKNVIANFTATAYTLIVTKAGTGNGTVTSNPTGINCGTVCNKDYAISTKVTLTASITTGSTFSGWSGGCSGNAITCTVTLDSAKSVTATFNKITYALNVNKIGKGTGTVTSNPVGIDCGNTCNAPFDTGTTVNLTAKAATGATFGGWAGACAGNGACAVTMNSVKTVVATFNPPPGDFIVTGITLTPPSPSPGVAFTANVTVKNQGTGASDGGKLSIWLDQANAQNCGATGDQVATVGSLVANGTKTVTFSNLKVSGLSNKIFRAFVDSGCATFESDETNNQTVKTYQMAAPDFVVTNLTVTPASPSARGVYTVQVTLKNQGTVAGSGGYLDVWQDQPVVQTCGAEGNAWLDTGTISAGQSKTYTLNNFRSGVAGTKTLRAFVDSWCDTIESDETNNQLTKSYTVK